MTKIAATDHGLLIRQDVTHSWKLVFLVLYKTYDPQKSLTSLIFSTAVSIGEGFVYTISLHNFFDNAPFTESMFYINNLSE